MSQNLLSPRASRGRLWARNLDNDTKLFEFVARSHFKRDMKVVGWIII